MSDDDGFKPYRVPDAATHPAIIVERLLQDPEHAQLKDEEVRIEYLMAADMVFKAGKTAIATMHLPTVQGRLKSLFDMLLSEFFGKMPDFLLIIDEAWWDEASAIDREALIWHELCHVKQETTKDGELKFDKDGNPVFALREHDVTAFNSEVERYGTWSPDLREFVAAAQRSRA